MFKMTTSGCFEMNFVRAFPNFTENLVRTHKEVSLQQKKICMCTKMCFSNVQIQGQLNISQITLLNLRSRIQEKMTLNKIDNVKKRVICF